MPRVANRNFQRKQHLDEPILLGERPCDGKTNHTS